MNEENTTPLLSGRSYDILKFVALLLLPALGSLYFGLSQIWGLPNGEEVVGTIVLLSTFLGVLLKTSDRSYEKSGARYDGTLEVVEDEDGYLTQRLVLDDTPESFAEKKDITFKVNKGYENRPLED